MAQATEEARRLGKVYGLLASAFVLFVIVITMLALFGLPEPVTAFLIVLITVVTYGLIGLTSRTLSLAGFYLADRAVPAGFNGMATATARLRAPTLSIGVSSDVLYPSYQQRDLASRLRDHGVDARYAEIDSPHGHDAFLLEHGQVGQLVREFLDDRKVTDVR